MISPRARQIVAWTAYNDGCRDLTRDDILSAPEGAILDGTKVKSSVACMAVDHALSSERAAVVAYTDVYCAQVRGLVAKKRITTAEGELLQRRIRAFGEDIAAQLHLPERSL
jgi:hypothetical protein